MAWTDVLPGSGRYPELMLEWAPTSKPTDASQTWVDITDRLRDWSWGYGRNDELGKFEAGSGYVILDNNDRALDPSHTAGPWFGNIKPRRMFRLRARWNGVIYPVFQAYARGFPQTYQAAVDGLVRVDLVDAYAILRSFDLVVGFTRGVELVGARIAAALDAINVPAALRDLDAGTVQVEAIDVTSAGTSGLGHAESVAADAEFGQLFVAKDGKVTFHDRRRRINSISAHTFTDDGSGLPYRLEFEPDWDETYLWNYVTVTGSAEDAVAGLAQDAASQLDYHTITKPISSPLEYSIDRQALAEYQTLIYAQPQLRAPSLPLNGAKSPALLWPVILGLEVSKRITVKRNPGRPKVGATMTLVQNVEGIRHTCKPGGPWETSVPTSPADTRTYWTVEDATYGLIDSGNLVAP